MPVGTAGGGDKEKAGSPPLRDGLPWLVPGVPVSEPLKLHGEVAHEGCFPGDAHAALDVVAAVIDVLQRHGDDIHVVVGVDAARDGEAQEVEAGEAVFPRDGVAVGEQVAYLTSADAGFEVELDGERLGGEFLLGHLGQHAVGIDEDGVAACGALVGDAEFVETLGEVFDLLDACLEVFKLGVLVQPDGQCLHCTQ